MNDIEDIDGFAEVSARDIIKGLADKWSTINHMLNLGFNLSKTQLLSEAEEIESPIAGLKLVFTGKMTSGSRDDMKKNALNLGAEIQSTVSGKTDILICGENVGSTKLTKAEKLGVKVLSEEDYHSLLNDA